LKEDVDYIPRRYGKKRITINLISSDEEKKKIWCDEIVDDLNCDEHDFISHEGIFKTKKKRKRIPSKKGLSMDQEKEIFFSLQNL
jgi:hypothetical protein